MFGSRVAEVDRDRRHVLGEVREACHKDRFGVFADAPRDALGGFVHLAGDGPLVVGDRADYAPLMTPARFTEIWKNMIGSPFSSWASAKTPSGSHSSAAAAQVRVGVGARRASAVAVARCSPPG